MCAVGCFLLIPLFKSTAENHLQGPCNFFECLLSRRSLCQLCSASWPFFWLLAIGCSRYCLFPKPSSRAASAGLTGGFIQHMQNRLQCVAAGVQHPPGECGLGSFIGGILGAWMRLVRSNWLVSDEYSKTSFFISFHRVVKLFKDSGAEWASHESA